MKRFLLAGIILILGFCHQTQASHYMGGEFKVVWTGGNDYDVSLILYRDCSGITMPTTVSVIFKSSTMNFGVHFPLDTSYAITPTCPGIQTTCNGGSILGYQKYIYRYSIVLAPDNWTISFNECCRNVSTTILNSTSQNLYIYFNLNTLMAPVNQPPYFTADPVAIVKNNSAFYYNHGVFDPDGDSVTVQLTSPKQNNSLNVVYNPPYNPQQFLTSVPPIFENKINGDLIIHPTQLQTSVYAVEVIEWNTDSVTPVMVSKQIREMWIAVINDTAGVPVLSGINPQATAYNPNDTIYQLNVMAGDTIDFNIYSYQQGLQANISLSYPKQIPGAIHSVSQNNTPNAVGHFFWVPTSTQIVQGPAVFLTQMLDDRCPYFNKQVYSYSFNVGGLIVFLLPGNPNVNLALGQSYTLTANCSGANTFDWYVDGVLMQSGSNPVYTFWSQDLGIGNHTVGCKAYNSAKTAAQGFEFVNVHVENTGGMEIDNIKLVDIFPNPADDLIYIKTNLKLFSIKLFDLQGRLIQIYPSESTFIDLSKMNRGVYILKINENINRKILLR